jgi:cell division protein FtsI (penicillin-binding protein 3)
MGLKDALYLLENMNVQVSIKGRGKVKQQSVEPGTSVGNKASVSLDLN